jgi:hypothetical protein
MFMLLQKAQLLDSQCDQVKLLDSQTTATKLKCLMCTKNAINANLMCTKTAISARATCP